eukprot:CAMPEP_0170487192 /NCGR_PEP_ID=MMETSP0208-20121228/6057_1 /TAXON_ID=197538 /ORGANISM="Strombidium inclinatum, Strain S3" /LENGTH=239 /DNA_ID=CAMNT_0010761399 /DNA_START=423 /DNA_END=1141 /DNA_ORIENTATION=+
MAMALVSPEDHRGDHQGSGFPWLHELVVVRYYALRPLSVALVRLHHFKAQSLGVGRPFFSTLGLRLGILALFREGEEGAGVGESAVLLIAVAPPGRVDSLLAPLLFSEVLMRSQRHLVKVVVIRVAGGHHRVVAVAADEGVAGVQGLRGFRTTHGASLVGPLQVLPLHLQHRRHVDEQGLSQHEEAGQGDPTSESTAKQYLVKGMHPKHISAERDHRPPEEKSRATQQEDQPAGALFTC